MIARSFAASLVRFVLAAWLVGSLAGAGLAASPAVSSLSVRGLTSGSTTTITLSGKALSPQPRLLLSAPIAEQRLHDGATAQKATFDVTLAADTPAGIYQLWVATADGISSPQAIAIDALHELPLAGEIASLPAALNGSLVGNQTQKTSFSGQAGQEVVIEVEARRLGANLNPVLHLYDERNIQLAWAQSQASIHGDARIVTTLPADGRYTIEVHDLLYRGAAPGHFRLKVGHFHFADVAFPLGVTRHSASALAFASTNLPPSAQVEAAADQPDVEMAAPWPSLGGLSGTRPRVVTSDLREYVEGGDLPAAFDVPSAVNGRISADGEEDAFTFSVARGDRLRFDVLANRFGSPLDGVLTIVAQDGRSLATGDDQPRTQDPAVDLTVPDGVTSVTARLKDLNGRGGAEFVYRLAVDRVGRANFSLSLSSDRVEIPDGDRAVLRVSAARTSYDGPIQLAVAGLGENAVVSGNEIPAGASHTLLALENAAAMSPASVVTIVGRGGDASNAIERFALKAETLPSEHQPWLRRELGAAATRALPIRATWSLPQDAGLPLGSSVPIEVTIDRAPKRQGKVRLSLLSSQQPLTKTVPAPAQNARRAPPNAPVEDTERMLRLAESPTLEAGAATAALSLLVPGDLADIPYDITVRAELLAADDKTVVATSYTPVARLRTVAPFSIELARASVEAKAGAGETGKLMGRVVRRAGFDLPVTITLDGLPPELPSPRVVVPRGKDEFALGVAFPYHAALKTIKTASVVGLSRTSESIRVRVAGAPVTIRVARGEEPDGLLPLFEDQAQFATFLSEGGGKVALETGDRYAGAASLRIENDKQRAVIPGFGMKIAENPGPGEYRYLRFAWKKPSGNNVLMQFLARGVSNRLDRVVARPAIAYEAGDGSNRLRVPATRLSEKLPTDWVVVTRDLFADFGEFTWDGIKFSPDVGGPGWFDHFYLARSLDDLEGCAPPLVGQQPLTVFEDEASFIDNLKQGAGTAAIATDDVYSGAASVKVTPEQKYAASLANLGVKIREKPAASEYRYLRFAWKKAGGRTICVQLNHDGAFGPAGESAASFRYDTGPREDRSYGAAIQVSTELPSEWTVVTRDLFADFGEFTLNGLALSPQDGQFGLFDHMYLGRTLRDFDLVAPKP